MHLRNYVHITLYGNYENSCFIFGTVLFGSLFDGIIESDAMVMLCGGDLGFYVGLRRNSTWTQ